VPDGARGTARELWRARELDLQRSGQPYAGARGCAQTQSKTADARTEARQSDQSLQEKTISTSEGEMHKASESEIQTKRFREEERDEIELSRRLEDERQAELRRKLCERLEGWLYQERQERQDKR
jgi:hypothetical protein